MATKNIFDNLTAIDNSYLLDPSVSAMDVEVDPMTDAKPDTEIGLEKLVPFKDHPFHVNTDDDAFNQLVESIDENGVIYPILVRPINGGTDKFEILSGHCRVEACRQLGLKKIPARIQEMDDFLATVIMTHTNISGRDRISISEKAKAYRMCMDQEKHQGISKGKETAAVIGAGKDSTRQVYRYVRLSYLIPKFLDLIDSGRIAVQIGYEIAFICERGQNALFRFCNEFKQFPNLEQAKELKDMDKTEELTYEGVVGFLAKPAEKKTPSKVSFKTKDLADFFEEDTDPEEMTYVIMKLLEKYRNGGFIV